MKIILAFFILSVSFTNADAAPLPRQLAGKSAIDERNLLVGGDTKNRGLVVVFLSAVCPCSNSHLVELKRLKNDFPDFDFVALHANSDEDKQTASSYFKAADLPFPVLRDSGAKWADEFKALKTPHAFIVLNDGRLAYQGGVSSSAHFDENTARKYLREALEDLAAGREVRTPEARTLGCVISRGGQNDW